MPPSTRLLCTLFLAIGLSSSIPCAGADAEFEAYKRAHVELDETVKKMRKEGKSPTEISAYHDQQTFIIDIRRRIARYRLENESGGIRGFAEHHAPVSILLAELAPLLREPLKDDALMDVLFVFSAGNHIPALPEQDRKALWGYLLRKDANLQVQVLTALHALGPYDATQVQSLAKMAIATYDFVAAEATTTLAAWPTSPGALDVLRTVLLKNNDEAAQIALDALVTSLPASNLPLTPTAAIAKLAGPDLVEGIATIRGFDDRTFLPIALAIHPDIKAQMPCRIWMMREFQRRKISDAQATIQALALAAEHSPFYYASLAHTYVREYGTVSPSTQAAVEKAITNADGNSAIWACQVLLRDGVSSAFAVPIINQQLSASIPIHPYLFDQFLDIIERNPKLGASVQVALTALTREDAKQYSDYDKMETALYRARVLDVLAKVADPSGAKSVIADMIVNSDQPEEQVAALRALSRLAPLARDPLLPQLGRFFDPAFKDVIINGRKFQPHRLKSGTDLTANTSPRIEAIRTLMASGASSVLLHRAALERLAGETSAPYRARDLAIDYPAVARESLKLIK
jgi:hypothetical protein